MEESLLGSSNSGNYIPKKSKKKLFLALSASLLLVGAIVGIVDGVTKSRNSDKLLRSEAHAIVKSSCSSTLYPDLCFSAISSSEGAMKKVSGEKDVIEMSINITIAAVEANFYRVKKLAGLKNITDREKIALHDCLETIDVTLDELHEALENLHEYPNKKSLTQHADDLQTLLSSAITNQETCLDGVSHEAVDKALREQLIDDQTQVAHMCSNALAMIKNMTDTDIAEFESKMGSGKLVEDDIVLQWPEWLSAADRLLLQSSSVTPDLVVAADGSGNFRTVGAAVAAAPEKSRKRYIIRIKAGVYRENVEVPPKKTNIMFIGDGRKNTIITGHRNVVDGSTTFNSATVGEG